MNSEWQYLGSVKVIDWGQKQVDLAIIPRCKYSNGSWRVLSCSPCSFCQCRWSILTLADEGGILWANFATGKELQVEKKLSSLLWHYGVRGMPQVIVTYLEDFRRYWNEQMQYSL